MRNIKHNTIQRGIQYTSGDMWMLYCLLFFHQLTRSKNLVKTWGHRIIFYMLSHFLISMVYWKNRTYEWVTQHYLTKIIIVFSVDKLMYIYRGLKQLANNMGYRAIYLIEYLKADISVNFQDLHLFLPRFTDQID